MANQDINEEDLDYEQLKEIQEQLEDSRQRALQNEPVFDPVILDALAELDLPLRGEFRQNVIERVREQVRNRRTIDGIASRISSTVAVPINQAITSEVEDRVQRRIRDRIEQTLENRGNR